MDRALLLGGVALLLAVGAVVATQDDDLDPSVLACPAVDEDVDPQVAAASRDLRPPLPEGPVQGLATREGLRATSASRAVVDPADPACLHVSDVVVGTEDPCGVRFVGRLVVTSSDEQEVRLAVESGVVGERGRDCEGIGGEPSVATVSAVLPEPFSGRDVVVEGREVPVVAATTSAS